MQKYAIHTYTHPHNDIRHTHNHTQSIYIILIINIYKQVLLVNKE
jgi:hypothetical protein